MSEPLRFGRFELRPDERRLLMDGEPVSLGARAFDVLLALVERRDRTVPKSELLDLVWPGLVVEENNLPVQVSSLRKILGGQAIATVAALGYRFTLPIAPSGAVSLLQASPRHNLPPQLTSFIGHEEDLEEYPALLDQTRLLTLTGIGGCGKTRLALKLAERMLPSFPDGVWYVDLAPVMDAERVALTIATTLGLREEKDRPIADTLCNRLAGRRSLLVLDNCEHLADACADLIRPLLGAVADLHVLVASREGLGIPGERALTVRSLSVPAREAKADRLSLAGFEAGRLFIERAQQVVPKFSLTDETAETVGEICRRLDGIPLAIELAAARVRMLSVEEIRARLDDRFRLLTGGSKAAFGRQQTLLTAIRWSYDHLAPDERQALNRLAVFVGGWTLAGATRVVGGTQDEYEMLDLLTRLADESLVTMHSAADGTTRYSMLETVRQYAHDRLTEAGESEAIRNRHLEFYIALAEEAEPALEGEEAEPALDGSVQSACLARLDSERDNLLAAHAWCDDRRDGTDLGLRLVCALQRYLVLRGFFALGHRLVMEALARTEAQVSGLARCRALWNASEVCFFMGRYQEAKAYCEKSLAMAREIGDEGRVAEALRLLAYDEFSLEDRAMARAHFEQALALSRRLGNSRQIGRALTGLADLYRAEGDLVNAETLYTEALLLGRQRGDSFSIVNNLINLAMTLIGLGAAARTKDMLREGFAIANDLGLKKDGGVLLMGTAGLAAFVGDWDSGARLHGATQALLEQMNYHIERADALFLAPLVSRAREALGAEAFAEAESAGRTLSYEQAIAEARAWLNTEL